MHTFWTTLFYQPIYNALVFLMAHVTFGDVGFAIIILTILVKLVLFPLSRKAIKSQVMMKKLEPELKKIKKEFPNKEEQAKKTFELYKNYKINPFSGLLVVLIQIPVIFALYYVFLRGLSLSPELLYSFVKVPAVVHTAFLGLIDTQSHSLILALLAGGTQYFQAKLMMPKSEPKKDGEEVTFSEQMSKSMSTNMKYVLPVIIALIAYKISAAVALYWTVSNITTIIQEWYVRRKLK